MNIYLQTYLFFNKLTIKLKLSTNFFWLNHFLLFKNHEKVLRALVNLQNKKFGILIVVQSKNLPNGVFKSDGKDYWSPRK